LIRGGAGGKTMAIFTVTTGNDVVNANDGVLSLRFCQHSRQQASLC
jgi:hypothetical protein